jgi:hypothetical protein
MAFIGNTNTTQAFTPAVDFFSGNASTTAFTLSRPVASVAQVQAVISNVPQDPGSAYTVSGNTITFTSAPPSGTNNIYVYYTSPITQVIAPGQGTVTSESFGAIVNFTTTGNTVLGDASTDTLNVGNGGLVKDASGNVGIGTSSPAAKLDVYTNTASGFNYPIFLSANNAASAKRDYVQLGFSVQQSAAGQETGGFDLKALRNNTPVYLANYGGAAGAGTWQFYTDGTERMRIDTSGNVIVGGTSTSSDESTYQGGGVFTSRRASSAGTTHANFLNGGSVVGSITSNTVATFYNTTSDYRLKENATPITNGLQTISALNPVNFDWISKNVSDTGFLAHEFQSVIPNSVMGTKDAIDANGNPVYQQIDRSGAIPFLVAAIQEQQALITALTARITALENK